MKDKVVKETELASLAKKYREEMGKSRAEAARELDVSPPTLFQAEELPGQSLRKLRIRIIQHYSDYEVIGPVYIIRKRK